MKDPIYLGDGVYAGHDGYNIWIWTDDGVTKSPRIALEPAVLDSLNRYREELLRQRSSTSVYAIGYKVGDDYAMAHGPSRDLQEMLSISPAHGDLGVPFLIEFVTTDASPTPTMKPLYVHKLQWEKI